MIVSQRSLLVIIISLGLSFTVACTNDDAPPVLEVDINANPAPAPLTPTAELKALNKVTGKKGRLYEVTKDVRAILVAQGLTRKSNHKDATTAWFEALKISKGKFGKEALQGWMTSYGNSLNKKTSLDLWAKLLLSETQSGQISPYMSDKNITTAEAINPYILKHLKKWLEKGDYKPNPDFDPPSKSVIPSDDPLLTQAVKDYCKSDFKQQKKWVKWSQGFGRNIRTYWDGLTSRCAGNTTKAMTALQSCLEPLGNKISTRHLAVNAGENLAVLQRRNGKRTDAANTYKTLMEIWEKGKIKRDAFGKDRAEYHMRKINDALWAARYRALIADHENGKLFAQLGLDAIGGAYSESVSNRKEFTKELSVLKAEAYHILAFRIAVEKGEFERAQSLSVLALQDKNLDDSWIDRLSWYIGFYNYLDGNYALAQKRWLKLLNETKDDTIRPKLYFWLAKTHDRMSQEDESEHYLDALIEDYPVSYYSVVAPKKSGISAGKDWRQVFGDLEDLSSDLKDGRDYNLGHVRNDSELGPLLLRSEILIAAGLQKWAKYAISTYGRKFSKRYILENHGPEFVYLTRLHYNSGNFLSAIALTTKLMRGIPRFWNNYPEQALIYFPKPFMAPYKKEALEYRLEPELLLAISRQESGFTPDIKSHAGAIGVMQLTPSTANRFKEILKVGGSDIRKELINPDVNIKMGAYYLHLLNRTYKGYKPAIYGGYNAGEYAMNAWMKRRAHSDPMVFNELIPFGETQGYIKNVWRNLWVYNHFRGSIITTKQPVVTGESTPEDKSTTEPEHKVEATDKRP
jgi:soluble lytic murein transglycosylase-like protein